MPLLYLIRHPKTQPDPSAPASSWRVDEEGQEQVRVLIAAPFSRRNSLACAMSGRTGRIAFSGTGQGLLHHEKVIEAYLGGKRE